jgi:hypothetical protein
MQVYQLWLPLLQRFAVFILQQAVDWDPRTLKFAVSQAVFTCIQQARVQTIGPVAFGKILRRALGAPFFQRVDNR